jgi:hypothetical protein
MPRASARTGPSDVSRVVSAELGGVDAPAQAASSALAKTLAARGAEIGIARAPCFW